MAVAHGKGREGDQLRRFYELKLERSEHPMFALSWTIFHVIDKTSPLYGVTADDLAATDGALVLNLSAASTTVPRSICMRGASMRIAISAGTTATGTSPAIRGDGRLLLDYSLFHEVTPEKA